MSQRLFNTAESIQGEEDVRKLISIYAKVEKESDEIVKRAAKKYQPPLPKKEVSVNDVLKMVSKPTRPNSSQNKGSVERKVVAENKGNIKQRISHLKQQINSEQKSLNSTRKGVGVPSKEELEYNIFRFKMLGKRVVDSQVSIERSLAKEGFAAIKEAWSKDKMLEAKLVLRRYKGIMRKYFDQFYKQTIILKLEREKFEQKQFLERQERNEKVAVDFREFVLYRRGIKGWREGVEKARGEKVESRGVVVVESSNDNLKDKLSNLLSKIREDINAPVEVEKQEIYEIQYNTIKQQFQESIDSRAADWSNEPVDSQPQTDTQNRVQQPPKTVQMQKKMTNDDLMKKRQQLQLKNKQRKQTLQKLKKQKQQLRVLAEEQKRVQEQQLREAERRKNKEQHQRFLQKRREEEERKSKEEQERRRMDDLYVLAEQHDRLRIMKYKGLVPWKKLLAQKKENLGNLLNVVDRVSVSSYWRGFKEGCEDKRREEEEQESERLREAEKYYMNRMRKKVIEVIRTYNSTAGQEQNTFLLKFRDLNCLRETLGIWKREIPTLKEQNYHEETKQNKLVQKFRHDLLLRTGFEAFVTNKQEQQRERRILEHKVKIKQKIDELKGKREEIDLDKFL